LPNCRVSKIAVVVNKQITELLDNNNALKMPLNECIEWFNRIPSCWNKSNFEDGSAGINLILKMAD